MNTQLVVGGVAEHRNSAYQRFHFKRYVVVHKQHVGGPLVVARMNETASKTTCTTQVGVGNECWAHAYTCWHF